MASIQKRKDAFCVVYRYVDAEGVKRQKWESFQTEKEALLRKAEIEVADSKGTLLPSCNETIAEFMETFVNLYGEENWGVSAYGSNCGLIEHYINPIIGKVKLKDFTTMTADKYIRQLRKTPPVSTQYRKARTEVLPAATIEKICKLMRCAFNQAMRWEMVGKNPFQSAKFTKTNYKERAIWDMQTICTALDTCSDGRLYMAINLSFACSMRIGEILGLTWDNIHISDDEIARDDAWLYVDKELERISKKAMQKIGTEKIYHVFPSIMKGAQKTALVLMKPKTDTSVRKIWIPRTLAYILREWRQAQVKMQGFLGDEYEDYNLVVTLPNGRPCEERLICKEFSKLKEKAGLPDVVFHSLRHSSTTYKLKLNHGDVKATQGDTGHARPEMVTRVYSHILDEDRRTGAQRFESAFYGNPDLRGINTPQPATPHVDLNALISQLQQSPELAQTLANLIAAGTQAQAPVSKSPF